MGLLISEEWFAIPLRYVEVTLKNGDSGVFIIRNEEQEKKYKDRIKEFTTMWKRPNFKETLDVLREASITDPYTGDRDIDQLLHRSLTIERFLKKWDMMDDKGEKVECTPENVLRLDPAVASALLETFNSYILPTEDQLKN